MSALDRLRATRNVLVAGLAVRALLWGAAAVFVALAASSAAGRPAPTAAAGAGLAVTLGMLWRGRAVRDAEAVALWIEERSPALDYALVTLADPRFRGDPAPLERVVAAAEWGAPVRRALARALAPAAAAAALAALPLLLLSGRPAGAEPGLPNPLVAPFRDAVRGEAGALERLTVRVVPPAYSGLAPSELRDPSGVVALPGSTLEVRGAAGAGEVGASLAERPLPVDAAGRGWSLRVAMPATPAALRLEAGAVGRLLLLEPRADSAPVVALRLPARDTVFHQPTGRIALRAEARDDLGLADVRLEYIVSSGTGELFTFRSGVLRIAAANGARDATLATALSLDSLRLAPGDFVHLRAVARDRNDVGGPGVGYSETRTLRVARGGEGDSVAVEGAPPPDADRSLLSQRMLIRLAESLQQRRARLPREALVEESRGIARDQARLRRQVGDVIFMRLGGEASGEHSHYHGDGHDHTGEDLPTQEALLRAAEAATHAEAHSHGDETPVVAINRPLLEAYNAMWAAASELEIAEPGRALPHMHAALAAIQRARQAERLYLRGAMPLVIVDVDRVRLAGPRPDETPSRRSPAEPLDDAARRRAARLDAAIARLSRQPAAAVDSLLLLRLDAMHDAPAAAAALGEAADALRRGRDATDALVRARRLIAGAPRPRPGLPRWSGGGG